MFDLGWTELLVIGIVSLIVVGPKDLPVLFRKAGQFIGCLLYTSPSPRDVEESRMPSSA